MKLAAVLVACAATMASSGWGQPQEAAEVETLSFSPDGRHLAVVLGVPASHSDKSASGEPPGHLVVVDATTGAPLWDRECASCGVGWASDPVRLIFGAHDADGLHLVSATAGDGAVGATSGRITGLSLGGIGTGDHLAAAVANVGRGRPSLYVWDFAANALTRAAVPTAFEPSNSLPPVIGSRQRTVAVVNEDRSFFLGFDVSARSWELPKVAARRLTVGATPAWRWQRVGSALPGKQSWQSGDGLGFQTDRFLVDGASVALWVAIANRPAGATQVQGTPVALTTYDELVPLDPDEACPVALGAWRKMPAPHVWREYAYSLSCDQDLRRIAVLYRKRGGADCVVYSASADRGWDEKTLVGDATVATRGVSISPTGERVALVRSTSAGQRVVVLDVRSGKQVLDFDPRTATR